MSCCFCFLWSIIQSSPFFENLLQRQARLAVCIGRDTTFFAIGCSTLLNVGSSLPNNSRLVCSWSGKPDCSLQISIYKITGFH